MAFHKSGWWIEGLADDDPEAMDLGGGTLPNRPRAPQSIAPEAAPVSRIPGKDLGEGWTLQNESDAAPQVPGDASGMTNVQGRRLRDGGTIMPASPSAESRPHGGAGVTGVRGRHLPSGCILADAAQEPESMGPASVNAINPQGADRATATPALTDPEVWLTSHREPMVTGGANATGGRSGVPGSGSPPIGGSAATGQGLRRLPGGWLVPDKSSALQSVSTGGANAIGGRGGVLGAGSPPPTSRAPQLSGSRGGAANYTRGRGIRTHTGRKSFACDNGQTTTWRANDFQFACGPRPDGGTTER
jgi:hypothetical protein